MELTVVKVTEKEHEGSVFTNLKLDAEVNTEFGKTSKIFYTTVKETECKEGDVVKINIKEWDVELKPTTVDTPEGKKDITISVLRKRV